MKINKKKLQLIKSKKAFITEELPALQEKAEKDIKIIADLVKIGNLLSDREI